MYMWLGIMPVKYKLCSVGMVVGFLFITQQVTHFTHLYNPFVILMHICLKDTNSVASKIFAESRRKKPFIYNCFCSVHCNFCITALNSRGLGLIPSQSIYDVCWTKWHSETGFSTVYLCLSFHSCLPIFHSSATDYS